MIGRIWAGLTRSEARTAPYAADTRLRGRTYAIPFDTVWQAATALIGGGLKRWSLRRADDREGVIEGQTHTLLRKRVHDVVVRVTLDRDAQTRVDIHVAGRGRGGDLGAAARRVEQFFRQLDAEVAKRRRAGARRHAR